MENPNDISHTPGGMVELRIESTAFGGKGVARNSGKVFFVDGGIEGDLLLAKITEQSDRYNEAIIQKLLEPSPHRGPSPCPVSDICGGCQWQGVPYSKQLEWKMGFIQNSLRRIGKVDANISIEMKKSPLINGYRNRIFMRGRLSPTGKLRLGYFRRASQDFVEAKQCAIASPRLNQFIKDVCDLTFLDLCVDQGFIEDIKFKIELQDLPSMHDTSPHLLVIIHEPDHPKFDKKMLVEKISRLKSVYWCGSPGDLHQADPVLFESHLGINFHTAPGIFQQINIQHNHLVRQMVHDTAMKYGPKKILDIFCGSGNLSLALASKSIEIDGIEYSKRAIDIARYNVVQNNLKSANYYAGDTEKFLWRAAKQGINYDMIIADPPREGMYKSLIPLMKIHPKHIIYISCDPTTLSRDLGSLCKKDYRVIQFVALDFFPNTFHVESFVILEAKE